MELALSNERRRKDEEVDYIGRWRRDAASARATFDNIRFSRPEISDRNFLI